MAPQKGLVLTLFFALISFQYGDWVMLIDALIVDRYEIKKFKLWNNNKKKQKEVM